MRRRVATVMFVALVVVLSLVAIASTAFDRLQAESQRCWASMTPDGRLVVEGC